MPGPLPHAQRRRRNAPTIPNHVLPAHGRQGPVPKSPLPLGKAGRAWWRWAWSLPQSTRWDAGSLYALAHRAAMEDDLAALDAVGSIDWDDVLDDDRLKARLAETFRHLAALAGGRLKILAEMRQYDAKFGLTPKAMAELRWLVGDTIADDADAPPPQPPARLRSVAAVDPAAAGASG